MSLLISSEDIGNYEQISSQPAIIQRLQIRIKQAQEFDLPKIISKELIADMVANMTSTEAIWVNLMNKIRPVMVYFALARHLEWGELNVSSFGNEKISTSYSQKLSPEEKEALISRAKSLANGYGSLLIQFLDENESDYENYKKPSCGESRTNQSMTLNIKAIG